MSGLPVNPTRRVFAFFFSVISLHTELCYSYGIKKKIEVLEGDDNILYSSSGYGLRELFKEKVRIYKGERGIGLLYQSKSI